MSAVPLTAFNFAVQLELDDPAALGLSNPLCDGAFADCDGLEMTMEPKTLHQGGANTRPVHLPGKVSYGSLTLQRGVTGDLALWTWMAAASAGAHRGLTARGVVRLLDAAGHTRLRFTLADCLPVKLKAPAMSAKDGQVAVEELQLAYGHLAIATGEG